MSSKQSNTTGPLRVLQKPHNRGRVRSEPLPSVCITHTCKPKIVHVPKTSTAFVPSLRAPSCPRLPGIPMSALVPSGNPVGPRYHSMVPPCIWPSCPSTSSWWVALWFGASPGGGIAQKRSPLEALGACGKLPSSPITLQQKAIARLCAALCSWVLAGSPA